MERGEKDETSTENNEKEDGVKSEDGSTEPQASFVDLLVWVFGVKTI